MKDVDAREILEEDLSMPRALADIMLGRGIIVALALSALIMAVIVGLSVIA